MKSAKAKSVRKKAPRTSASKPSETPPPVKAFESITLFKNGTSITIVGMTDGSTDVLTTPAGGKEYKISLSSEQVSAFLRTLANQAVSAGLTMEDLL